MLLCGRLRLDEELYFQYIGNKLNMRWTIYHTYTKQDRIRLARGEQTQDATFNVMNVAIVPGSCQEYVISSVRFSRNGKKMDYFGNTGLIERFIAVYNRVKSDAGSNGCKFVDNGSSLVVTDFEQDGVSMETTYKDEKVTRITAIKGLEVVDFFSTDNNKNSFGERVGSLRAKTLSQIIDDSEDGLSWYYNKDGSSKKKYEIVNTYERLDECIKEMNNVEFIAVDTETTGLMIYGLPKGNKHKSTVVGTSLTWKRNQAIYIPFDHLEIENLDKEITLQKLKNILTTKKLITHNGLFDGKVYYDEDLRINIEHDTQILAFNLNPTVGKGTKGLNSLTRQYYGHHTIELGDIFSSKDDAGLFRYLPKELVKIYACADSDYTYQLFFDMWKELPVKQRKVYGLDIQVMKELIRNEYKGNKVDMELLEVLSEVNNTDIAILEELIYKYVGQAGLVVEATRILSEKVKIGEITQEDMDEKIKSIQEEEDFKHSKYTFKITSGDELAKVMYGMLGYPVTRVSSTTGKPSTDVYAIKDLLRETADVPTKWLSEDVMSSIVEYDFDWIGSKDKVLISKSKFESAKYPFVVLLQTWKKLNKLKTSFFAELEHGNTDGWYYKGYSMTSAETGRIINPIQTLIGHLKKLIIPYSEDYYMVVADYAQIEYRVMAGLSNKTELVESLMNPESDYHREGGAALFNTTPEDMTSEERDEVKAPNFAVPYGMGAHSLAEIRYGRASTEAERKQNVENAEVLLAKWKKHNWEIQALLEAYRKSALTPFRTFNDRGVVANNWGRRWYFELDNLTNKQVAAIERKAGNYPIQSFARELFATGFVRMNRRIRKEGLEDKIFMPNLVHDEVGMIVHKSVHPYRLMNMIQEEMVLELKGHPTYFMGVNVVDNWYEGKSDKFESPAQFIKEKSDEWKTGKYDEVDWVDNPKEYVFNDIKRYMQVRILKEVKDLQPNISKDNVNFEEIMPKFKNYFVKPRVLQFTTPRRELTDRKDDNLMAGLEDVLMKYFNDDLSVKYPGEPPVLLKKVDSDVEELDLAGLSFNIDNDDEEELLLEFDEELSVMQYIDDTVDISVPVQQQQEYKDSYTIKDVDDVSGKEIWELVDFGDKVKRVDSSKTGVLVEDGFGNIVINITGIKVKEFDNMFNYLKECVSDEGSPLIFVRNKERKVTGMKVRGVDPDKISQCLNKGIMDVLI